MNATQYYVIHTLPVFLILESHQLDTQFFFYNMFI